MNLTREQYLDLIAIAYRARREAEERIEKHRQLGCETWFGEHMLARAQRSIAALDDSDAGRAERELL